MHNMTRCEVIDVIIGDGIDYKLIGSVDRRVMFPTYAINDGFGGKYELEHQLLGSNVTIRNRRLCRYDILGPGRYVELQRGRVFGTVMIDRYAIHLSQEDQEWVDEVNDQKAKTWRVGTLVSRRQ
jgi:hypothetical protein